MAYTRQSLIDEALANLGIVQQADTSATRTSAELVTEALGNLGLNQQAYAGNTRTRAAWVTETLASLGLNQQAYAGGTRTRADLVTEAMGILGINQAAYTASTRTRADLVTEAMANLGLNQVAYTGGTKTRAELVAAAMAVLGVVQKTPTVSAGTKTLLDLTNLVLFNLGALGEGQTASAEAQASVQAAVDPVVRLLDARQIVSIANINAIDNAYFLPLGAIIAEAMKEQFGIDADTTEAAGLIADAKQAELDLKIITRSALVDAKLNAIAADITAHAIAPLTVPIVTVPEQWFPDLARIVGHSIKGYFEWLGADVAARATTEAAEAERRLRILTGTGLVDEKLDSLAGELFARAIVPITAPVVTVPPQYFTSLAAILANSVKGKFEWLSPDTMARLATESAEAERKLRTLSGTALVDEKIDSIAAELSARAIVTLTVPVVTVPEQYFPALTAIVADSVKGKFDWIAPETAQRVAAEAGQAEIKLRTLSGTALVDEKLDAIASDLTARAVVILTVPVVTVPEQYFGSLAAVAANSVKGKFPWLPPDALQRVAAEATDAELKLRQVSGTGLVSEKLPSLFGELNARGVATVTNANAIPGAWFSALADITAESVRGKFVVLPEIAQRVTGRAVAAERTLKNLTRTYIIDRNIDAILSELAAREIVYLMDLTDIPQEWFTHVAWIVADRCKSKGFDLDPVILQNAASEGMNAISTLREMTRGRPSYNTLRTSYM